MMPSSISSRSSSGLTLLKARWIALAPRERLALGTAAWVLGLGLLWWLALSPALQTLRAAQVQHIALDRQYQIMRGLQNEAQALLSVPKISTAEALKALEASTKQDLGTSAQLNVVGERVTVTFKNVPPDTLAQWLAQTRVNAHALPTEAKLTRSTGRSSPAAIATTWDGHIVLRLP